MSKDTPNAPPKSQTESPQHDAQDAELFVVQLGRAGPESSASGRAAAETPAAASSAHDPHPRRTVQRQRIQPPPHSAHASGQGRKRRRRPLTAATPLAPPLSQPPPSRWAPRWFPDASECLRDYPEFDVHPDPHRHIRLRTTDEHDGATRAAGSPSILEADREQLFCLELLRIFRQRLRLTSSLGLLVVPLFALVYLSLSPTTWKVSLPPHLALFAICLAVRLLARRASSLLWVRLLSLVGYAMLCTGLAVVVAQTNGDPALGSHRLLAYAGYNQILLSLLLLPYSVWENLAIVLIAMGSLAWSTWMTASGGQQGLFVSQLFTLDTTALVVVCIGHFQSVLRRRAFDSAFDLAYTAAQMQTLSTSDQVTGGHNRRHLEKALKHEIARAARFAHPLSVIMFDLDNFKRVNDTLGHRAGDEVLREVWKTAIATVRGIDSVARYGGDEFTIVLPETNETDAYIVAERLLTLARERLQSRFGPTNPRGQVTLSIGLITFYLTAPIAVETVLEQADQRLYQAKRTGKNRIASSVVA